MQTKYCHAVRKMTQIGDGSRRDMASWLEKYCNALFPENGIEYVTTEDRTGGPSKPVPGVMDVHHVAVYWHDGNCEGRIIRVALCLKDQSFFEIAYMKLFSPVEECMELTRALNEAVASMVIWEEEPLLVGMFTKVPKRYSYERHADPSVGLWLEQEKHSASVINTDTGEKIDDFALFDPVTFVDELLRD